MLKSFKRVFCGFLDAIKGIIKGDISMKDAYHFTEGSREQRKKDKEEVEKAAVKKMQKDISDIADIMKNKHAKIVDEEETMWLKKIIIFNCFEYWLCVL